MGPFLAFEHVFLLDGGESRLFFDRFLKPCISCVCQIPFVHGFHGAFRRYEAKCPGRYEVKMERMSRGLDRVWLALWLFYHLQTVHMGSMHTQNDFGEAHACPFGLPGGTKKPWVCRRARDEKADEKPLVP